MKKKIIIFTKIIIILIVIQYTYKAYLYSKFTGDWINGGNSYEYTINGNDILVKHPKGEGVFKYKIVLFTIQKRSISTPSNIIFNFDTEEFDMTLIAKKVDSDKVHILSSKDDKHPIKLKKTN